MSGTRYRWIRLCEGGEENMRQSKKPTLAQKKVIVSYGLMPDEWLVHYENSTHLHLVHKETREIKILEK